MDDLEEKNRLVLYFAHRYASLIVALKENFRSRKLAKQSKSVKEPVI
jgi:hypothetical protein